MIGVVELTSGLMAVVVVLFGGGGLTTLAIKKTWSDKESGTKIFLDATALAEQKHAEDMKRVREDFTKRMSDQSEQFEAEIEQVRQHIESLHEALAELLTLVDPAHTDKAMRVLVKLGLPVAMPRTQKAPQSED